MTYLEFDAKNLINHGVGKYFLRIKCMPQVQRIFKEYRKSTEEISSIYISKLGINHISYTEGIQMKCDFNHQIQDKKQSRIHTKIWYWAIKPSLEYQETSQTNFPLPKFRKPCFPSQFNRTKRVSGRETNKQNLQLLKISELTRTELKMKVQLSRKTVGPRS